MQTYFGNFKNQEDVIQEFWLSEENVFNIKIIYACYDQEAYDGHAHIIFLKKDKLFEVNASHCSCNGLDGQWKPEETDVESLLARPGIDLELRKILNKMKTKKTKQKSIDNKDQIKNLIMFIAAEIDYDVAKSLDPETAEEPDYAEETMNDLITSVSKYLKKNKLDQ